MLAGNPMLRSFSNTLEQRAINYACLGVSGPETNHLPLQNCPNGVRAQVFFPSCWDGVNLDSTDHKSHMAYPDRVDSGKCPPSHPKRFISLFYEVTWDTAKFNPRFDGGKQPFVFSNGDETGYGYHGDFVNGWDVATLQRAVTECTNLSGNIEDCPVFELFSNDFSNSCKIPSSVDEDVFGTLRALPGCNPSTGEGPNAVKQDNCGAPTSISPPSNPFVDLTVSKNFRYIGCGKDNIGGRTLTGASLDEEDMTNEKCVDFCISQGFSIAGTEYSTQCYCGTSLPQDRAPVEGLMGDCFMPCGGDTTENCGGGGTISLYQKCGATCSNISYGVNNGTVVDSNPAAPAVPVASTKAAVVPSAAPTASTKAAVAPVAVPTPSAIIKAPAAPADEDSSPDASTAAPILTVSASSAISNAKPATKTKAAFVPGIAPGRGANRKVAAKCAGEVTVTIAATTITVTGRSAPSSAPETGVKIPVDENRVDEESPVTGPTDEEEDEDNSPLETATLIEPTATNIVQPVFPTIAPTDGPFNNGTTNNGTTGNGEGKGKGKGKGHGKGHGRFHHSHRPSGGYAMPTGAKKN